MQVSLICNLNQARSKIAESFCARQFPQFQFKSYGIKANEELITPRITIETMHKWKLPIESYHSSSVDKNLLAIYQSDLLIAADENVKNYLLHVGLDGEKIICATDSKIADLLPLQDPVSLSGSQFEFEIAKFVLSCSQILNRFTNNFIETDVVIPANPESQFQALRRAEEIALSDRGTILNLTKVSRTAHMIRSLKDNYNSIYDGNRSITDATRTITPTRFEGNLHYPELLQLRNETLEYLLRTSSHVRKIVVVGPHLFQSEQSFAIPVLVGCLSTDRIIFIDASENTKLNHFDSSISKIKI
jgi:protein-tyrosine-phosphatase